MNIPVGGNDICILILNTDLFILWLITDPKTLLLLSFFMLSLFFFNLKHLFEVHWVLKLFMLVLLINSLNVVGVDFHLINGCLDGEIGRILVFSDIWTFILASKSLSVDSTLFKEAIGAIQFFLDRIILHLLLLFHQSHILVILLFGLILLLSNHFVSMTW